MAAKKEFDIKMHTPATPKATGEFTLMAPSGQIVQDAIAQGTHQKGEQPEVSPQEKAARMSSMRTQGRKGLKAIRINMAFSPENHAFIQVMARATGKTMTGALNEMLDKLREANPEIMEQAQRFTEYINSGEYVIPGKRND